MKKLIYLTVFLVLISFSSAVLDCDVISGACPMDKPNKILGLSSNTNAHAELASQNNYGWKLCCNENILDESCSAGSTVILKLSDVTNAHVGSPSSSYSNSICLKDVSCYPNIIPASEEDLTNYIPLVSRSALTNAHLAGDLSYNYRVYCTYVIGGVSQCTPTETSEDTSTLCSNNLDDDCDGGIDLDYPAHDTECVSILDSCGDYEGDATGCRSINDLCYYSDNVGCQECLPSTKCYMFTNVDDCETTSQSCFPEGSGCAWDTSTSTCKNECANDEDGDTVCDSVDNCVDDANPNQLDSDNDGTGDACDSDTDESGISSVTCKNLLGTVCSSTQNCMWGHFVSSSDSSGHCCLYGTCGITQLSLDGSSSYILDSSDCIDANEDGIGKKMITKLVNGAPTQGWEEDCTTFVLDESVPFYSYISMLLTIVILFGFYYRRLK